MPFYVTHKIMILLLIMMLPIAWGHASSPFWHSRTLNDVAGNGVCPDGQDPKSVLYEFELFVLHKATICDAEQRDQIKNQLNQLLNDVLQTVPRMISAETSLCLSHQQGHSDQTRRLCCGDRGRYVYRGSARCRYCDRDNLDDRRRLVNNKHEEEQQCEHGWTTLLRTKLKKHDWEGWTNTRQFPSLNHCGQHADECLGPYKSGETISKILTVPKKTIILRALLIVQHDDGAPWKNGDTIIFRLGNKLLIQVPIRLEKDVHQLKSKEYSVIVEHVWSQDGKSIVSTIVRLHFHTLDIFSKPNQAHKIKFAISTRLTSSGGGQEKVAVYKGLTIKFAQTCGRILPLGLKRKNRNKTIRQWERREFLEALLSFRMTRRFRQLTGGNEDHCLRGTKPFIYLHMKQIEEDNGEPLECRA